MTTATIEPRIRARRIAVQRSAGHRRLGRVLVAVGVLLVPAAALAATQSPLLDVDRVTVAGADDVPSAAVIDAAGIDRGRPMVTLDLERAAAAVEELPTVDEATIVRSWPGSIRIEVSERVPRVAVSAGAGGFLLIDREGELVEAVDVVPADMPLLADISATGEAGDRLPNGVLRAVAVAAALGDLSGEVDRISPTRDGAVLHLAAGGLAEVGPAGAPDQVIDAVAAVLAAVPPGCVERIDVRAPGAPVLVRAAGCEGS